MLWRPPNLTCAHLPVTTISGLAFTCVGAGDIFAFSILATGGAAVGAFVDV